MRVKRSAICGLIFLLTGCEQALTLSSEASYELNQDYLALIAKSQQLVASPPWPEGDEQGMANAIGPGTWMRCGYHLSQPDAKVYELSQLRSNQMPSSKFGKKMAYKYSKTSGAPGLKVAWHTGTEVSGMSGAQGTQMDAFAHWGFLDEPWTGQGTFPTEQVKYYGGHRQTDVKPEPEGPLKKLGIDKAVPIISSAVLLDAKTHLGNGRPLQAGQLIHGKDIAKMIVAQGLEQRGLLPGDVLYIYTGWGDNWNKPVYYQGGPGLSYDAAKYLESKRVVLVALDNPFTDAINLGQFSGKASSPSDLSPEYFAPVHYYNLTQSGIHNIQNANLKAMAEDQVWTSCTFIQPIKVLGASSGPVSPVAIGASHKHS